MRLYHRAGTGRPFRVAWALEEAGVQYESLPASPDDPQLRALAPLGRVPVLQFDDGTALYDSTAILIALGDRLPDAGLLAPPGSHDRELALQYMLVAQTELEKAATNARRGWDVPQQTELFRSGLEPFAAALDGHDFLVGDRFGAADIVLAGVLLIGARPPGFVGGEDNVTSDRVLAYLGALKARPALHRALERTESLFRGD